MHDPQDASTRADPFETPPDKVAHADLWAGLRHLKDRQADAEEREALAKLVMQRIEGKLDTLVKIIGAEHEDERGQKVGTGIVGRLMRLESRVDSRFRWIERWTDRGVGLVMAVTVLGAVIWWLVKDKLSGVFH